MPPMRLSLPTRLEWRSAPPKLLRRRGTDSFKLRLDRSIPWIPQLAARAEVGSLEWENGNPIRESHPSGRTREPVKPRLNLALAPIVDLLGTKRQSLIVW